MFVHMLRKWAGSSIEFERLIESDPGLSERVQSLIDGHIQQEVIEKLKPQLIAAGIAADAQKAAPGIEGRQSGSKPRSQQGGGQRSPQPQAPRPRAEA